jgi:hypothetical protein
MSLRAPKPIKRQKQNVTVLYSNKSLGGSYHNTPKANRTERREENGVGRRTQTMLSMRCSVEGDQFREEEVILTSQQLMQEFSSN